MANVHPTAILGERITIGEGGTIGPHAIIEDDVVIGDGCRIGPGAFIGRLSEIGSDNEIGMNAQIGGDPQILGWKPVDSRVVIGSHNVIREFASIHRAKEPGAVTSIGDHCYLMGSAHVAHDCVIHDHVVLCNGALIAGHVEVGDHAFISGNCAIHQFVRVGRFVMMQGLTAVSKNIAPFTLIDRTNTVRGLNRVGLRRSGISPENRQAIKEAFREIFRSTRPVHESLAIVESSPMCDEVREMVEFIRSSKRGICLSPRATLAEQENED
jgi:UDP-N-acetylglucosamine acyltransferase